MSPSWWVMTIVSPFFPDFFVWSKNNDHKLELLGTSKWNQQDIDSGLKSCFCEESSLPNVIWLYNAVIATAQTQALRGLNKLRFNLMQLNILREIESRFSEKDKRSWRFLCLLECASSRPKKAMACCVGYAMPKDLGFYCLQCSLSNCLLLMLYINAVYFLKLGK